MERSNFEAWLSAVELLTAAQRGLAFRKLALAEAADVSQEESETALAPPAIVEGEARKEPAAARGRTTFADIAEVRFARDGCPHCGCPEVRRWGGARGLPRYRCAQCRKTFDPFTAPSVAGLHNKDRWLDQGRALFEGESLARRPSDARSTRAPPSGGDIDFSPRSITTSPERLSGVVEAD